MRKSRTKILSLFLALVMCLTLLPTAALAEEEAGNPPAENEAEQPKTCSILLMARPGLFPDTHQTNRTMEAEWTGSGYRLTSAPPEPTLSGQVFEGWQIGGSVVKDIENQLFDGNTTIWAKFGYDLPSFNITFDANGGRFPDNSSQTVVKTNVMDGKNHLLPPSKPYRSGYNFYKWDPIEDPFNYNFTEDTTIKALWGYEIEFFKRESDTRFASYTYRTTNPSGKLESLPKPVDYPSHTFRGWSTSVLSDSDDFIVDESYVFTGPTKLYPKWALSNDLSVTLNTNGGSVITPSISIGADGKLTETLPTPTRSGYTFTGWFLDGNQVKQDDVYNGPATLIAKWTRNGKISPNLSARVGSATSSRMEIILSCASNEGYLNWRPLERLINTPAASYEAAAKNYVSGNFSDVGLKLVSTTYHGGGYDFSDDAYPRELYPDGVCPTPQLTLNFEGSVKPGTMTINLASNLFVYPVAKGQNLVVDQSSADLYNDAKVTVTIGGKTPTVSTQTSGTTTTTATPSTSATTPSATTSAATVFADVAATSPFATAIGWAVEKGITNGTTATTFAPGNTTTRGQIVTFLYRGQVK